MTPTKFSSVRRRHLHHLRFCAAPASPALLGLACILVLSACATPVHVVAPASTVAWTCDEEPEPPDRRGHGFIGPGKVTARDGASTAEIPNGYGVSVEDWHAVAGYITRLTKAYCTCRLAVDGVNRRAWQATGPRAMCLGK